MSDESTKEPQPSPPLSPSPSTSSSGNASINQSGRSQSHSRPLDEDIDQPPPALGGLGFYGPSRGTAKEKTSGTVTPPSLVHRSSSLTVRQHASPLDEEDDDHLFQNIGLLTQNCASGFIGNSAAVEELSSNCFSNQLNFDKSETFTTNQNKASNKSQPEGPLRSWEVKLQAAPSYSSLGPSTSSTSTSEISTSISPGDGSTPSVTISRVGQSEKSKNPSLPTPPPLTRRSSLNMSTFPNSLLGEENFNFVSVEHADTSFPVFLELWQNNQVCDVTIVVGERRFAAHRVVLCATIPYFYSMFTIDLSEKNATEVVLQAIEDDASTTPSLEADAFESLLRYAYTGSITINSRNVQSILIGASFLGLLNVQQACADYLKIRLNVANVLAVKTFAFALGVETLVLASKRFIHRHFAEISRSDDFLALEFQEVVDVVDKDELNIKGEDVVFEAILAWTKKDEASRKFHLPTLLSHVRLPLLSPEYLTDTVMVEKLVRSSLPCRDLVDEAKDYHLLPARRELLQRFRTRPRFGNHIQGLIYAVGGLTKSGDSMSTVEVYDPTLKRWRMTEAMTMMRSRVGVAVLEGKLYAIGGYNGKERLNTVEVYDSKLKRWNKVKPMSYQRSAVGAAPLEGYLYVCGGYDGTSSLNAVERYSSRLDRWDVMANMNYHRSAAGIVAFDGFIYVLGGHDGMMIFNSVERYDRRTDRWEVVEPMLTRRCRLGVTAFGGKIYVCGGYDGITFLDSAEVYNPNTNKWTFVSPMRVTRSRVALVANVGRLFAIGGYDGITNLSSVETYDVERDSWEFTASMVAHEGGVGVGVIPEN